MYSFPPGALAWWQWFSKSNIQNLEVLGLACLLSSSQVPSLLQLEAGVGVGVPVPPCTRSPVAQLETHSAWLVTRTRPPPLAASAWRLGKVPANLPCPAAVPQTHPSSEPHRTPWDHTRPPSWASSLQILTPRGLRRAQEPVCLKATASGVLMVGIGSPLGITCAVTQW